MTRHRSLLLQASVRAMAGGSPGPEPNMQGRFRPDDLLPANERRRSGTS